MRLMGRTVQPLALVFGLAFTLIPLIVMVGVWNFGSAPPVSILWPRQEMRIVSSDVRQIRVGNGTTAAYVDVAVAEPDTINAPAVALLGITWGWVPVSEAEKLKETRYPLDATVTAMRAPDGELYVVRWRFADVLALFVTPLSLLMLPIGLFAFRLAFS